MACVSPPVSETCSQGRGVGSATCSRSWTPQRPLDLRAVLAPLRRGRGDPTMQVDADGTVWRAGSTPAGAATLALRRDNSGTVHATGWGPGAAWALRGLPALLGADDDDSAFVSHHPLVAQVRHRMPGLRLGATRRVWDVLVAAVLEQKVTGVEARRSWRELCWRFGEQAPGPAPDGRRGGPAGLGGCRSSVTRSWAGHWTMRACSRSSHPTHHSDTGPCATSKPLGSGVPASAPGSDPATTARCKYDAEVGSPADHAPAALTSSE
jgi:hypothetical protein